MTTYATRSPLQPLHNPHMMSELRRSSRRISANAGLKEDAPTVNGIGHETERGQKNGSGANSRTKIANGGSRTTTERNKRKIGDEEDGDFAFTRTRAKKAKAELVRQSEPMEEVPIEKAKPLPARKSEKKALSSPTAVPSENEPKEKRRRSPRNSGEQIAAEPAPIQIKKRRLKDSKDIKPEASEPKPSDNDSTVHEPRKTNPSEPVERIFDATKIALPFADTPIIRRNKEMRKGVENGHRRSSLGNRGRRASSLIDSGKSNALPHDEVESSEFYKHIENGLPEPRRMKQLLTWCGTRALGEKPSSTSEDFNAGFAAREIQQQLLKDFSTKSEMSDWFSRRDSTPQPQTPKPNPKNIANLAKIQDLELQISRLQLERQTWESLLRPPPTASRLPPPSPTTTPISPTLLSSPSQIAALSTLHPPSSQQPPASSSSHQQQQQQQHPSSFYSPSSLSTTTSQRIQATTQTLEFEIDKFADNVHTLGSFIDSAGRVADEVLALSARALEARDRSAGAAAGEGEGGGGEVGIRNVLRGLSRVV